MPHLFSNPYRLSIINGLILLCGIAGNAYYQVFCNPVPWALLVLIICFANSVASPILLAKEKFVVATSFINGVSLFVFIYCFIFLISVQLIGFVAILFFGLGLLVYIPNFFIIQIIRYGFVKLNSSAGRRAFIVGTILAFSLLPISAVLVHNGLEDIEHFEKSKFTELNTTYMTERILGMGFIYHVRFCEFDGWRPPKHDPLLNMGLWLNGNKYPLTTSLGRRKDLYKKFFPGRPVKFECSCADEYKEDYFKDTQGW